MSDVHKFLLIFGDSTSETANPNLQTSEATTVKNNPGSLRPLRNLKERTTNRPQIIPGEDS